MNKEREEIEALFEQVIGLPRGQQLSRLEEICGENRERMQAVLELLDSYAAHEPLLSLNAAGLAHSLLEDPDKHPAAPERAGRYRIREALGHGGMGSVYLAEREDVGGRVAIKFLRDPWGSPARWERFGEEQQTLAQLNHRHIASLFDAGVENGAPWFAMEYVEGHSITEYCRIHGCGLEQRLLLFRAACEAVSYAHRNFVVHLDLKPSNILVNTEGEVKLLDFGIAKHLSEARGTADQTTVSLRLISVNYAAPEQVDGETVGVETDIHGLGVVLYELLTGRVPAELQTASATELARRVHATPEKPSVAAARNTGVAAGQLKPAHMSRSEGSELDVLCLTAMHRDRERRYPTAADLIHDVDRFLNKQTLQAQPDSAAYRVRKFLQRHRVGVTAAAGVVAAVTAMAVLFTMGLVRAKERAVASQARTERIQHLMLNLFEGDDSSAGPAESLRVVDLLDRGVREAQSLRGEPDLQAELEYTLGDLYFKLGHLDRAEPLLRSSLRRRREQRGGDLDVIRSALALSAVRSAQSETDEAAALALEAQRKLESLRPRPEVLYASSETALGSALSAAGSYEKALPVLEDAVRILEQKPPTPELSTALGTLANAYYYVDRRDQAERVNLKAVTIDRQMYGQAHPEFGMDLFNLGVIELDRGSYVKAGQLFTRSLGIIQNWYGRAHPRTAESLTMLGRALQYQGRFDDAGKLYNQALRIYESGKGASSMRVGVLWSHLGLLAFERGKLDDAETAYERSSAIFRGALGEKHGFYLYQQASLAGVYVARGEYAGAEAMLRPALERLGAAMGRENRYTALAQLRLAKCLAGEHRYREAEAEANHAYAALKKEMGSQTAEVQAARRDLIAIYQALNEGEKARGMKAELLAVAAAGR